MLSPLAQQLLSHLRHSALLPAGSKCLIAISGGGDSVALLRLLCELRPLLHFELYAAHLNHSLRPEADDDCQFVAALCERFSVPLDSAKIDVATYAQKHGYSLEEAGRKLRYRLFRHALQRFGATHVLTAHTASDQAETVLMRLIAGTGLSGLSAVRPQRNFGRYTLVRPLLPFQGEELRAYLTQCGQPWREDSTNHEPTAPRTKIRLQLLPLLKEWNPQIVTNLSQFSERVRGDESLLQRQARRLAAQASRSDDTISIDLALLRRFPAPLRVRAYRLWLRRAELRSSHIEALEKLVHSAIGFSHLDLPHNLSADIVAGQLRISPQFPTPTASIPDSQNLHLRVGIQAFPEFGLSLELSLASQSQRPSAEAIYLSPAALQAPLTLRPRRPGDTFYPAGGRGQTKLKKYLNELKLPPSQRQKLPLLCCGEDIVWVVGYRADQRFLAHPNQTQVWKVELLIP